MAASQDIGDLVEAAFRESKLFVDGFREDPIKSTPSIGRASIDALPGFSTWKDNPGYAGQIKSVKRKTSVNDALSQGDHRGYVGLASARALAKFKDGLELNLCVWTQDSPTKKTVNAYVRMLFKPNAWCGLLGSLPMDALLDFENEITTKTVGLEPKEVLALTESLHKKARSLMATHDTIASLNVKIDSRGNRRLQCNCAIADLAAHAAKVEWILPSQFNEYKLPAGFASGPRHRLSAEQKISRLHSPHAKAVDYAALPAKERPLGARGTYTRLNRILSSIRRENLLALFTLTAQSETRSGLPPRGASKRFAATLGVAPAALSNMLHEVKSIGRKAARSIEISLSLEAGSLDQKDRYPMPSDPAKNAPHATYAALDMPNPHCLAA